MKQGMAWLIITEKANTARKIASILFSDAKQSRKHGIPFYHSSLSNAWVVGLKGHIVALDFPSAYNNWRSVPLKALLKAEILKEVVEKKISKLLEDFAKKATHVTIATDYDREGELIGFEALEIIRKINPNVRVDRVKYSAITPSDIKTAFSNPTNPDENLARAAEARQKIDLIWGAVLTRLVSISSGRMGKDFLSVGRVQSPTLRLVVEREKEIESFKPEPYWEIFATFAKNGEEFEAKHVKRFKTKEEAENALGRIGEKAIVTKFKKKEWSEEKPIPFNTTEFLKEASKFMSPDRAMSIAETLYINGYISYPRTDNTIYPPTLNLKAILEKFINSDFRKETELVLSQPRIVPSKGKRETKDHPPIYPTSTAMRRDLKGDEWRIYELVVRRFLASLAPNALWEIKTAEIDASKELFKCTSRKLLNAGWRAIYLYSKMEESYLPDLKLNEVLKILKKDLIGKETRAPPRFTTGKLIKLMEKLGLGTKSTRHEIIKKLYSRRYVYGNPLRPTQTAFAVIDALKRNAEIITLSEMTAKLEGDMDLIAEGRMQEEEVVRESINFLEGVLNNIDTKELSKSLKNGVKKDKVVGKCPECGRELVIRRGKGTKRFIGCSGYPSCNFTLPLPQRGAIYITAKECKSHGIRNVKIRKKNGYWDLGCLYCNYLEWKSRDKI
jgi:DNA topoisomerase-1